MDELKNLDSLGLVLPSPAYIGGAILSGLVGYAVSQTWLLWAVGAAFCGWVYVNWN
jgi:uncharacterized membrane protein YoaK (UPF0700 family)